MQARAREREREREREMTMTLRERERAGPAQRESRRGGRARARHTNTHYHRKKTLQHSQGVPVALPICAVDLSEDRRPSVALVRPAQPLAGASNTTPRPPVSVTDVIVPFFLLGWGVTSWACEVGVSEVALK